MARDTLKLETVQLDTLAEGKLWDDFHELLARIQETMPMPGDNPEHVFFHPTKAREISIKILLEPKDGGVVVGYEIDSKVPVKKRSHGGFAQFDGEGRLVQFAGRQQALPGVGPAGPVASKVTPIRKQASSDDL